MSSRTSERQDDVATVAPSRPVHPGRPPAARVRLLVRRFLRAPLVVLHRWVSLVLGLVLLVIATSGAGIVFQPELARALHPGFSAVTHGPVAVSPGSALAAVRSEDPGFRPGYIALVDGLYILSSDDPREWGVDAATGRVTGHTDLEDGVLGFLENAHECFFACEGYPGYLPFLSQTMPGAGSVLPEGATWGTGALVVAGVMLLFLCVSGAVIWLPRLGRLREGFTVRWRRGRYARDVDLHRLIGLAAIPFLAMWAITGIDFELPLSSWWYAITSTSAPATVTFTSKPAAKGTPDIGIDAAVGAALARSPGAVFGSARPVDPKDPKSYFDVWLATPDDPWRYSLGPGDREVAIDRHDAARARVLTSAPATLANRIWDDWRVPAGHFGVAVNGWWRIVWFAFGLTPLVLATTGVSTWLWKHGVARRRRLARRARAQPARP